MRSLVAVALWVVCLALAVLLGACAGAPPPTPRVAVPAAASDQLAELRDAFVSASLSVTEFPATDSMMFGTASREVLLRLGGADVYVHEFPSSGDASSAAFCVNAGGTAIDTKNGDGTGQTQFISWAGRPHFFRRERLVVLYLSQASVPTSLDRRVLAVLQRHMGPQFAGDPRTR